MPDAQRAPLPRNRNRAALSLIPVFPIRRLLSCAPLPSMSKTPFSRFLPRPVFDLLSLSEFRHSCFIILRLSVNRADGISEIEDKAARVAASEEDRARFKSGSSMVFWDGTSSSIFRKDSWGSCLQGTSLTASSEGQIKTTGEGLIGKEIGAGRDGQGKFC